MGAAIPVTLGRFDIPVIQMQPPFTADLLESNIALFGAAMSGKTTFLRTLICILHKTRSEEDERIFLLDFGGALGAFSDFPLVAACFDNSNEEYVKRAFKILEGILKENTAFLNGANYRDADPRPAHTTFIIDNLNAFMEEPRYTSYQEKLAKLCRDGLSKGITVVFTAADTKGVFSLLGSFKQKIALEMPADKYTDIFSSKAPLIAGSPGRGFANVTVRPQGVTGTFRMNLPYEVQLCVPYTEGDQPSGGDTQAGFEAALAAKFALGPSGYARRVKRHLTFPKELSARDYGELRQDSPEAGAQEGGVGVGLDYVDFMPVRADLERSPVTAIYGKKEFGKTNLLSLLLTGMASLRSDARFVLFDDGRNQLEDLHARLRKNSECVMFNRYADTLLTRTDGSQEIRRLSPLQQFYVHLNKNFLTLDRRLMGGIYGVSPELSAQRALIPECTEQTGPFTVFVVQSKLVYLNAPENRHFITTVLPQMQAAASDRGYALIFSDVGTISDAEQNSFFNNTLTGAFLLDNIAEFASERGSKTVFGAMDTKALKEDYARCERGDGYYYDIEADSLVKLKFIKN